MSLVDDFECIQEVVVTSTIHFIILPGATIGGLTPGLKIKRSLDHWGNEPRNEGDRQIQMLAARRDGNAGAAQR